MAKGYIQLICLLVYNKFEMSFCEIVVMVPNGTQHPFVQGYLSTVFLEECRKVLFFELFSGQIINIGVMNGETKDKHI